MRETSSKKLVLVKNNWTTCRPALPNTRSKLWTNSSLNWISWDIRGMKRPVTRIKSEPEPDSFKQMLGFSRRIFHCFTQCFPIWKRNICSNVFAVLWTLDRMGLSLPEATGHQTLLMFLLLGKKVRPGMHCSSRGWTHCSCHGGTDHGINISIMAAAI